MTADKMAQSLYADQRLCIHPEPTGRPLTDKETMSRSILTYVNQKSASRPMTEEISPRISGYWKIECCPISGHWHSSTPWPAANPIPRKQATGPGSVSRPQLAAAPPDGRNFTSGLTCPVRAGMRVSPSTATCLDKQPVS
jgi:hypothetical protein